MACAARNHWNCRAGMAGGEAARSISSALDEPVPPPAEAVCVDFMALISSDPRKASAKMWVSEGTLGLEVIERRKAIETAAPRLRGLDLRPPLELSAWVV